VVDVWSGSHIPLRAYIACVVVPLLALCSIRNLKLLAPFSLLSNILVAISLGIVFYYIFTDIPHTETKPHFSTFTQLPLFFSTAVFALEGIGVIMPIENNMITPQNFTGNFRVLNTGMTVIITMYAALGYFGYLKYGDCTEGSVSLNLPDEPLAQSTKLMLALAVCLTYPLQMYVAVQMTWGGIQRWFPRLKTEWKGPFQPEHVYRMFLVLFTACIALAIPALDSLMGLIGAVCISTAGLLFPAILETVYRYENLGKFKWIMWKNIIIFLFGTLGFVTGVWTSIVGIIASF
ncbi:proton-coupled amino acid transporter-like protein pathetic, partial [Hetaerina americana]|uniref:proton-coupled amino acid transporter-like protein pathetic n=1 Tax=Hetaerina americana TaxID=62018 RepID=UPI003A7F11D9